MIQIRANEMENHRLRRQDMMEGQQAIVALKRQRTSSASSSAPILNQNTSGGWTNIFLDQLSFNPQIGQLVATSGGLVTHCKFFVLLCGEYDVSPQTVSSYMSCCMCTIILY